MAVTPYIILPICKEVSFLFSWHSYWISLHRKVAKNAIKVRRGGHEHLFFFFSGRFSTRKRIIFLPFFLLLGYTWKWGKVKGTKKFTVMMTKAQFFSAFSSQCKIHQICCIHLAKKKHSPLFSSQGHLSGVPDIFCSKVELFRTSSCRSIKWNLSRLFFARLACSIHVTLAQCQKPKESSKIFMIC